MSFSDLGELTNRRSEALLIRMDAKSRREANLDAGKRKVCILSRRIVDHHIWCGISTDSKAKH